MVVDNKLSYISQKEVFYENMVPDLCRKNAYVGKSVKINEVNPGNDYSILIYVNDGKKDNKDDSSYGSLSEKWKNLLRENHYIDVSLIGSSFLGTQNITYDDGERKVIYRVKLEDGDALLECLSSNINIQSIFMTPEKDILNTRVDFNEKRIEVVADKKPVSIVCFDKVDAKSLETAIDYGIDIDLIDRVKTAKLQIERIHEKFLNFESFVINGENKYRKSLCEFIALLGSMKSSFNTSDIRNIMVQEEDSLFSDETIKKYFDKLFEDINILIENKDTNRISDIIKMVKIAIDEEEEKCNYLKNYGVKIELPFDKRYVMREIDKIERKSCMNVYIDVNSVQTLDNLKMDLSKADRLFNTRWSKNENQLSFAEIVSDIDEEFIRNNIDSIYRNGLYVGFSSHDVSHIERTAVYSSIIASRCQDQKDIKNLAILAAIFHDCGRVTEGEEKHGDYSAAILRNVLSRSLPKEDINVLCGAVDFHDENDESQEAISKMVIKYRIKNRDRFVKIYKILKDADALDRVRFIGKYSLDIKYLRYDISKQLVKFATELNEIEAFRKIEELFKKNIISKKEYDGFLKVKKSYKEILFELKRKYRIPSTSPLFIPSEERTS